MATYNKFYIYLDGHSIGSASSIDKANKKLTKAVLNRAIKGNGSAVTGEIKNTIGDVLQTREFGEAIYSKEGAAL
jgi:hypothetical protein